MYNKSIKCKNIGNFKHFLKSLNPEEIVKRTHFSPQNYYFDDGLVISIAPKTDKVSFLGTNINGRIARQAGNCLRQINAKAARKATAKAKRRAKKAANRKAKSKAKSSPKKQLRK